MPEVACNPYSTSRTDIGLSAAAWESMNIYMTAVKDGGKNEVAACCYPNILNVANDCVLWCELPSKYLEKNKDSKDTAALTAMNNCVQEKSGNTTGRVATLSKAKSAAADRQVGHAKALGLLALLVAGYVMVKV